MALETDPAPDEYYAALKTMHTLKTSLTDFLKVPDYETRLVSLRAEVTALEYLSGVDADHREAITGFIEMLDKCKETDSTYLRASRDVGAVQGAAQETRETLAEVVEWLSDADNAALLPKEVARYSQADRTLATLETRAEGLSEDLTGSIEY